MNACRSVCGPIRLLIPARRRAADDPPGAVAVQAAAVGAQEHRPVAPLADGQVDGAGGPRSQGDSDDLAALAGDYQGPVAPLDPEPLDVRAGRL
jgi:hypothetical protein